MSWVRFPSPAPDFSSGFGQLASFLAAAKGNRSGNFGTKTDRWRQKVPRKSRVAFARCSRIAATHNLASLMSGCGRCRRIVSRRMALPKMINVTEIAGLSKLPSLQTQVDPGIEIAGAAACRVLFQIRKGDVSRFQRRRSHQGDQLAQMPVAPHLTDNGHADPKALYIAARRSSGNSNQDLNCHSGHVTPRLQPDCRAPAPRARWCATAALP